MQTDNLFVRMLLGRHSLIPVSDFIPRSADGVLLAAARAAMNTLGFVGLNEDRQLGDRIGGFLGEPFHLSRTNVAEPASEASVALLSEGLNEDGLHYLGERTRLDRKLWITVSESVFEKPVAAEEAAFLATILRHVAKPCGKAGTLAARGSEWTELFERHRPSALRQPQPGFFVNWLDIETDAALLPYPDQLAGKVFDQVPSSNDGAHGNSSEYALILLALEDRARRNSFTIVELGSAWGPWISAAGAAARRLGITETPADRLEWLISRFMESGKWATTAPATRRQRELLYLSALKNGNPRFASITRKHMQQAVEDRARTPALAKNYLKAMRALFGWAVKNDHLAANPCDDVEPVAYKSDGFPAWNADDVHLFCERWPVGTSPRLALELFVTSGLRRGDMHKAGRQHLRGNVFSMRTAKTNVEITVEFPPSLLATIAATQTGDLHFIVKSDGQPFTSKRASGTGSRRGAGMPA